MSPSIEFIRAQPKRNTALLLDRDKYRFCYKLVPFLRRTFLRIFCVFLSILFAFGPKGCIQFMHLTTHFCAS